MLWPAPASTEPPSFNLLLNPSLLQSSEDYLKVCDTDELAMDLVKKGG
jgi:hypothetical protein